MKPRTQLVVATGMAFALTALAVAWWARTQIGADSRTVDLEQLGDYGEVPPFALTERSGRTVTRDDLRGLVWAADFIYTDCKDTCPTLSLQFAKLQREFAGSPDLRLVSITIDPEHDTPAVLRQYAERYAAGAHWLFLTGAKRAIDCLVRDGFKLPVEGSEAADCGRSAFRLGPARAWAHGGARSIMHTSRIALIDGTARIRAYHSGEDPASLEKLRTNVRRLLAHAT